MHAPGCCPTRAGGGPALERQPFMQHEERLMIAEVLIHHLDVMRFLCGELRVVARGRAHGCRCRRRDRPPIFLETAAGAPVEVTGTMAAPGYPPRPPDRLEVVGSKASATFARRRMSCAARPRPAQPAPTIPNAAIRRASTASSRISSTAWKPARPSRPVRRQSRDAAPGRGRLLGRRLPRAASRTAMDTSTDPPPA